MQSLCSKQGKKGSEIYLPIAMSPQELNALRLVKKAFDPHNIMNPDKMIPDLV